jgi:hypothetical protein
MRCFYDDLPCAGIEERDDLRAYVEPGSRKWMPARDEHTLTRNPFLLHPDLRAKFARLPLTVPGLGEPQRLLIIHNKYNLEWGGKPVNFLDCPTLDRLFGQFKQEFKIVYIRHGSRALPRGYSTDANDFAAFPDAEVLAAHPEVLNFEDLLAAHQAEGGTMDVNTFKNVLYSRCHRFISVQGGGSHHIACFKGSLLVLLHKRGAEADLAYTDDGYYSFVADPAPMLAVCRSTDEVIAASVLFNGSRIADGRLVPRPLAGGLFDRFNRHRALRGLGSPRVQRAARPDHPPPRQPAPKPQAPAARPAAARPAAPGAPAPSAPATSAPANGAPATSAPAIIAPAIIAPAIIAPATSAPAANTPAANTPATSAPAANTPPPSAPALTAQAPSAPVPRAPEPRIAENGSTAHHAAPQPIAQQFAAEPAKTSAPAPADNAGLRLLDWPDQAPG